MNLFHSFQPHELILLILGTLLFIILLIKLIKEKDISKNIIFLMVLAVGMIGFSAVSKLAFHGFVMELNHAAEAVAENPSEENIKKFNAFYDKLTLEKARRIKPEKLVTIASALEQTGQHDEAYQTVKKALLQKPSSNQAQALKQTIERSLSIRPEFTVPAAPGRSLQPRPTPAQ